MMFGELVRRVVAECCAPGPALCLLLEAPLSVAFAPNGNPTGRRPERRDTLHRYWYNGLGTAVLTSATYLMRAITDCSWRRDVLLFEGFVSFKTPERRSSHVGDTARLRDVVNAPESFPGAIIGPAGLVAMPGDSVASAFAVAGMDYGVPAVVLIDV